MRVSDLIIFDDYDSSPGDERRFGTVLRFDTYSPGGNNMAKSERVAEVLWNTGHVGWIHTDRIRAYDEMR